MKHVMNMERGDMYFSSSDIGWVVGHSYIVYAPLLVGACTLLYEVIIHFIILLYIILKFIQIY